MQIKQKNPKPRNEHTAERLKEIKRYMRYNLSDAEIGRRLQCWPNTIKHYRLRFKLKYPKI